MITKKHVIELLEVTDLPKERLSAFYFELKNINDKIVKEKNERLFMSFVNSKLIKVDNADYIKDLNPKTVGEIVIMSGVDIEPQRAGFLISLAGYIGAKNKAHRKTYPCIK